MAISLFFVASCGPTLSAHKDVAVPDASASVTPSDTTGSGFKVIVFDVGEGDAALVISPEGEAALIDIGPPGTWNQKLGTYLNDNSDINLKYIILTHSDSDHAGALAESLLKPDDVNAGDVLKLGDNVSTVWDAALATASSDWSVSDVLDTAVVSGLASPKNCKGTSGRVEVCNSKYGNNGWLGIAQISITGGEHITKGIVKFNDTYFNTPKYNTIAWRNLVACQEIGHTLGLDHQDENFNNANLGTCMDYTNDPDGGPGGAVDDDPSNEHPNDHDFAQLEIIYAHFDSVITAGQTFFGSSNRILGKGKGVNGEETAEWGKSIRSSSDGKPSLFENDLGKGNKVFTFVIWADKDAAAE